MRRYLVVAYRTLDRDALREAIRHRMSAGPARFHLVVPVEPGAGLVWDEGSARLDAEHRLEDVRLALTAEGVAVTGEVGHAGPVDSVGNVLRRDGVEAYDEIVVSTLPLHLSKWMGMDVPSRIARLSSLPVDHVVATPVHA